MADTKVNVKNAMYWYSSNIILSIVLVELQVYIFCTGSWMWGLRQCGYLRLHIDIGMRTRLSLSIYHWRNTNVHISTKQWITFFIIDKMWFNKFCITFIKHNSWKTFGDYQTTCIKTLLDHQFIQARKKNIIIYII